MSNADLPSVRPAAAARRGGVVSTAPAIDDLEPRIRRMIAVILANRAAICGPRKGTVELHFNGRHVSAHLVGHRVLEEGEPPGAA